MALRVYDLDAAAGPIRIDSTSAKTYATVDENGWFQWGHSKDHHPDLPQIKISWSTRDPLGLPLTTTVVGGNCADDPLYVPEIQRVQQTVGVGGKTYIGDSKMGSSATRAWIKRRGDNYWCPPGGKPSPAATLDLDGRLDQALVEIDRLDERQQGKKVLDAAGLTTAAEQIVQQHRYPQERLLELLGWSTDLYERVVENSQEPASNLSEL